jgi:hypothetical protein
MKRKDTKEDDLMRERREDMGYSMRRKKDTVEDGKEGKG